MALRPEPSLAVARVLSTRHTLGPLLPHNHSAVPRTDIPRQSSPRVISPIFPFVFIRFSSIFLFVSSLLPIVYLCFTVFARCTSTSSHLDTLDTLYTRSPIPGPSSYRPAVTLCHPTRVPGKDSHERCRCVPSSLALH